MPFVIDGTNAQAGRPNPDAITWMLIRPYCADDRADLWSILEPTIRQGETYALDPAMNEVDALAYWTGIDRETFVAVDDGAVLGTYYLRANQAGGGSHVANCGYMTALAAVGRGVARRMCEHSLERARARGFRAMQFNFVVSTNERAIRLWQSYDFATVGRLPLAFGNPVRGYVDALVMHRSLSPDAITKPTAPDALGTEILTAKASRVVETSRRLAARTEFEVADAHAYISNARADLVASRHRLQRLADRGATPLGPTDGATSIPSTPEPGSFDPSDARTSAPAKAPER